MCHLYREVEGTWPVGAAECRMQYQCCHVCQWELRNTKTAPATWRYENGMTSGT